MFFLSKFGELNHPYEIASVTTPLATDKVWMYDFDSKRFELRVIDCAIDEYVGPTATVSVGGTITNVPLGWHVLVCDSETADVDTIPIQQCISQKFEAACVTANTMVYRPHVLNIIDVSNRETLVLPVVEKNEGIVICSTSKGCGIIITPTDQEKRIRGCILGDIFQDD